MKKRPSTRKVAPQNGNNELFESLIQMAASKVIDWALQEGPAAVGKLLDNIFSEKKPASHTNDSNSASDKEQKIINADFSGLGNENWWEVLGVNINTTEEEIHEATEKLLSKKSSTKTVSEKTQKNRELKRKKYLERV